MFFCFNVIVKTASGLFFIAINITLPKFLKNAGIKLQGYTHRNIYSFCDY